VLLTTNTWFSHARADASSGLRDPSDPSRVVTALFSDGTTVFAATASNGPIATAAAFGPVTPIAAAEGAAALRGTTTLNGRLVAEAGPLARAVAAKSFPVSDVVKVLRRMSADTRAAAAMVKALDGWPAAGTQQAALAAFYAELGSEIDGALAASSRSVAAYKTATRQVVATLAKVAELDAASRSLAADVGLSLPVIVLPEAAP